MALKTFNLDEKTYKEFSKHCKSQGISMSKKVENFLKQELEKIKRPFSKVDNSANSTNTYKHAMTKYC